MDRLFLEVEVHLVVLLFQVAEAARQVLCHRVAVVVEVMEVLEVRLVP
jgi:hypothetical protein